MRDMANTSTKKNALMISPRWRRLLRARHWVQAAFLAVWMAPISALRGVPGCAFHCYACPLASFACPVGVAANFSALHMVPLMVIGVVVLVGSLVGSLVCGWACPFGFVQDLLARITRFKLRLPSWTGCGRYFVLAGLVIVVPFLWGEEHPLFICRVCPAGALEGGLGVMISGYVKGTTIFFLSTTKWMILGGFVLASVFFRRPWCKVLCPLGGALAVFNRISFFHIRFRQDVCVECPTCRSRCSMGVNVRKRSNSSDCIRCLECTACGAVEPAVSALGRFRRRKAGNEHAQPPAQQGTD